MAEAVLVVEGVTVDLGRPAKRVLDDVDLTVRAASIHALIGGSGSGKTTLARVVAGLVPQTSGFVRLSGPAQMVFQDPFSSLDPRYRIGQIIGEALTCNPTVSSNEAITRVDELMKLVALERSLLDRFPEQLSGGECQRVAIARAIAARPTLLIADEVTSSLDVMVQARIIDLLDELATSLGISILLITHNLAIADRLADDLTVLERGRVVERGVDALAEPHHNYTRLLVDSLLTIETKNEEPENRSSTDRRR
jgi:peptide/nickel transport system ATP-binding protein